MRRGESHWTINGWGCLIAWETQETRSTGLLSMRNVCREDKGHSRKGLPQIDRAKVLVNRYLIFSLDLEEALLSTGWFKDTDVVALSSSLQISYLDNQLSRTPQPQRGCREHCLSYCSWVLSPRRNCCNAERNLMVYTWNLMNLLHKNNGIMGIYH